MRLAVIRSSSRSEPPARTSSVNQSDSLNSLVPPRTAQNSEHTPTQARNNVTNSAAQTVSAAQSPVAPTTSGSTSVGYGQSWNFSEPPAGDPSRYDLPSDLILNGTKVWTWGNRSESWIHVNDTLPPEERIAPPSTEPDVGFVDTETSAGFGESWNYSSPPEGTPEATGLPTELEIDGLGTVWRYSDYSDRWIHRDDIAGPIERPPVDGRADLTPDQEARSHSAGFLPWHLKNPWQILQSSNGSHFDDLMKQFFGDEMQQSDLTVLDAIALQRYQQNLVVERNRELTGNSDMNLTLPLPDYTYVPILPPPLAFDPDVVGPRS